jgi:flagellar protein FliJ
MTGKPFRFSLQPVLDFRRHEAEHAEATLAQAVRARRAGEAALAEVTARYEAATREGADDIADPTTFLRHAAHRQQARRAVAAAAHEVDRLRVSEQRARRELLDRRRPEEALLTLRARARDDHRSAEASAELAFLDEQAVGAYRRRAAAFS